jgi:GH24 family phage-related lysozyme (muramidase)
MGQQNVPTNTPPPAPTPATTPLYDPGINPNVGPSFDQLFKENEARIAQLRAMPGATVPYMATPTPSMRMPAQPTQLPTNAPINPPVASGASLEERRRARSQGWGNMIGNALGQVVNRKNEQDYNDKLTTGKQFADAQIHRDEALRVLKLYPNDPAAKQVLKDADAEISQMQNDPKTFKILKGLMPNYVDPTKDKDKQAREASYNAAFQSDMQGLNNDTLQQRQVSNTADKTSGLPPAGAQQQQQTVPSAQPQQAQAQGQPQQQPQQGLPPIPFRGANEGAWQPPGPKVAIPTQLQTQPQEMAVRQQQEEAARQMGVVRPSASSVAQQSPELRRQLTNVGAGEPSNEERARRALKEAGGGQAAGAKDWQKFHIPTQLQMTPEYKFATEEENKLRDDFITKTMPKAYEKAIEIYKESLTQGNQNYRRAEQEFGATVRKGMDDITRLKIQDSRADAEIRRQTIASAATVRAAQIKAGVLEEAMLSDPRLAPYMNGMVNRQTRDNNTEIARLQASNKQVQATIDDLKLSLGNDPLHPGHPIKPGSQERQKIEGEIQRLSLGFDHNNDEVDRLQTINDKLSALAQGAGLRIQGGTGGGGVGAGFSLQAPQGTNQSYIKGVSDLANNPSRESGMAMTKSFETLRLTPYRDMGKEKRWDIGIGHSYPLGSNVPKEITPAQAEQLYQQDYSDAEHRVTNALQGTKVPMVAGAILTDLAFQSGYVPKDLVKAIQAGDWNKAADVLYEQRNNSGPDAVKTLTQRFGLESQVLRALAGGGGTDGGAGTGTVSTSGQPAGSTAKPSAAIPITPAEGALSNLAFRYVFGQDPISPYITPSPEEPEPTEPEPTSDDKE